MLLLQVSAVPGLQIRRCGTWISVDLIPGALVANVGDVVKVLTNGRYAPMYRTIGVEDYVRLALSSKLQGERHGSVNIFLFIINSR
ncbi:Thebaine 6-O-demethylase [Zea mays]|uniref:Thebaine 6-O-demethylase n=1 Tax=Zea mays TaxID=4577 RepID=A0A3L6E9Q2_MAIZE|nr:Thebaine 6-O-demethylase [Zea mays]